MSACHDLTKQYQALALHVRTLRRFRLPWKTITASVNAAGLGPWTTAGLRQWWCRSDLGRPTAAEEFRLRGVLERHIIDMAHLASPTVLAKVLAEHGITSIKGRKLDRRHVADMVLRWGLRVSPGRAIDGTRRPSTRGSCPLSRPCPWLSCRYHLGVEYWRDSVRGERLKLLRPEVERGDLSTCPSTCALDLVDAGPMGLPAIARLYGTSKNAVHRILHVALEKVNARAPEVGAMLTMWLSATSGSEQDWHREQREEP